MEVNAPLGLKGADPALGEGQGALEAGASLKAGQVLPLLPPQAVNAHPVLEILNTLRSKGIVLPDTALTPADAAKLAAAAQALPEGPARAALLSMARAIASSPGGNPASGLNEGFDKSPRSSLADPVFFKPDQRRLELPAERLRWSPALDKLPAGTRGIPLSKKQIVGQNNALRAIYFGLRMTGKGYNLYVSGPEGSGRESAVRHILSVLAPRMPTPPDLVAATNLEDPKEPVILELEPGAWSRFEEALAQFLAAYQAVLPKELSSGQAKAKRKGLEEEVEKARAERLKAFEEKVSKVRVGKDKRFGIHIYTLKKEEGRTEIRVVPTYEDKGRMRTVGSEEELHGLVEAGQFAQEDWEEAAEQGREAARVFLEELDELIAQEREMEALLAQAKHQVNAEAAADLVSRIGISIVSAVTKSRHDTPEHKDWEKKVRLRRAGFMAETAKVRVGPYGVLVNEESVLTNRISFTHEVDGRMRLLDEEELEAKLKAGGITEKQFEELLQVAKPWIKRLGILMRLEEREHQKLHSNDPPPTQAEVKARAYVVSLLQHAAIHYQDFLPRQDKPEGSRQDPSENYRVSVLATGAGNGAPVIFAETHSYEELFGSADENKKLIVVPGAGAVRTSERGGPILNSGLFHKANGGFLVLDVMKLLSQPGAYPALMQAIETGKAEIAEGGLESALTLSGKKHQVPARVKVVLIGSPVLQMLLRAYDDQFARNFNAIAEFEPALKISDETLGAYLLFMKKVILQSEGGILEMTREAVAAVLEFAAREAESNQKLTAQFGLIHALMREASFWARESGRQEAGREDVELALKAKEQREGVYENHYLELLMDRVFVVETDGARVGQVNGLAVLGSFGVPERITVVTSAGRGMESVDRQALTTGPDFNKALGDVWGYLNHVFAQVREIAARISISFEQNYGEIDGDSATQAKIYGGLSSLSGMAIEQGIAVTGSADQFGNVQAIGGVNEKIKGFFALCAQRGLTGRQGVIIPAANAANLMLSPEIVKAVREGRFHIWAVSHVSEGIEILTGVPYRRVLALARTRLRELGASNPVSRLFWRLVRGLLSMAWRSSWAAERPGPPAPVKPDEPHGLGKDIT